MTGSRLKACWLVAGLIVACAMASQGWAHHGWGWASDELSEKTGEIVDVRLGNPHGEVDLKVNGQLWTIEVGQPWRNERAGLTDQVLVEGREMTVLGNPSTREGEKVLKAVRVTIGGTHHDLYEGRLPDAE